MSWRQVWQTETLSWADKHSAQLHKKTGLTVSSYLSYHRRSCQGMCKLLQVSFKYVSWFIEINGLTCRLPIPKMHNMEAMQPGSPVTDVDFYIAGCRDESFNADNTGYCTFKWGINWSPFNFVPVLQSSSSIFPGWYLTPAVLILAPPLPGWRSTLENQHRPRNETCKPLVVTRGAPPLHHLFGCFHKLILF